MPLPVAGHAACYGGPRGNPGGERNSQRERIMACARRYTACVMGLLVSLSMARATDIEREPINYSKAPTNNRIVQAEKPKFTRQGDSCLLCHGGSTNQGFPGQLVRSLYADADGFPILSSGSHRVDHTSPLENRWGGWYVSGKTGKQLHMGNLIIRGR